MDWQVILTSVITSLVSSSVITAGIIYILKKSVDRAIDYRFEKSLEEYRLRSQENTRRQATIYDKQLDILKEVLGFTYRLRNAARDLAEQVSGENPIKEEGFRRVTKKIESYNSTLIELLFEERALLPPTLFKLIHDLNNQTAPIIYTLKSMSMKIKSGKNADFNSTRKVLIDDCQKIDEIYQSLVNVIQTQIGVVEEKGKL